jgi:uncharacterized membrane protein
VIIRKNTQQFEHFKNFGAAGSKEFFNLNSFQDEFFLPLYKKKKLKPLIVLITLFVISLITIKIGFHKLDTLLALKIAMSGMLVFTAIGHFAFGKGMAAMLPEPIPFKTQIIYLTGIAELISAVTLLVPALSVMTAWFLIVFFLVILPANISAAMRHVNYQKGTHDGPGPRYLWFRIPLQLFFLAWVAAIIIL